MVHRMHPDAKKFKLMQLVIRGGARACTMDPSFGPVNEEMASSDESVDEL